jgi:hypothetical protein
MTHLLIQNGTKNGPGAVNNSLARNQYIPPALPPRGKRISVPVDLGIRLREHLAIVPHFPLNLPGEIRI